MKIEDFKTAIRREFGNHLEHATPANVREFLDRISEEGLKRKMYSRFELNETATTYEEILIDFFDRVLDFPKDEALILLWTMAFDLSFSTLERDLSEKLDTLFRESE